MEDTSSPKGAARLEASSESDLGSRPVTIDVAAISEAITISVQRALSARPINELRRKKRFGGHIVFGFYVQDVDDSQDSTSESALVQRTEVG